jgi:carbamoyl-phosphate synthase large subunit
MPFNRFRTYEGRYVDTVLGPEMRSTGEVMGIDAGFGVAFAKSQAGAQNGLPTSGTVFVSVANRDKRHMVFPVKRLADLGFEILATSGTASVLRRNGVEATVLRKLHEEPAPGDAADDLRSTVVEKIQSQDVQLIINTPHGATSGGSSPRVDGYEIRTAAVAEGIPCITTVQGLGATVQGIEALIEQRLEVASLQEWADVVRKGREG